MKGSHVIRLQIVVGQKVFHNECESGGIENNLAKTKKQLERWYFIYMVVYRAGNRQNDALFLFYVLE